MFKNLPPLFWPKTAFYGSAAALIVAALLILYKGTQTQCFATDLDNRVYSFFNKADCDALRLKLSNGQLRILLDPEDIPKLEKALKMENLPTREGQ